MKRWGLLLVMMAVSLVSFSQVKVTPKVAANLAPSVTLTGCVSNGAVGFNFYRGSVHGGPYTKIGTATTCNYSDTTVAFATTYYYVATALESGQESSYSNEAIATTGANPNPTPPTGLTASPVIAGNVPLQWQAPLNEQVKGYRVYRQFNGKSWDQVAVGVVPTNYLDHPPRSGPYSYEVRAVAIVGKQQVLSAPSNVATVTVP